MTDVLDHYVNICNEYNSIITVNTTEILNQNIEIPNIQRLRNDNKVQNIVNYQIQFYRERKHWNFLGNININYCKANSKYYLIDGQHRFESLKQLYREHGHDVKIRIELVIVNTFNQVRENYELINQNTQLPEFPDDIDKTIPEETMQYFINQYKTMISDKPRSNRPNINSLVIQHSPHQIGHGSIHM